MPAPRRSHFKRGATYVAVRFIHRNSKHQIAPGEVVKGYRRLRMRNWYRRGIIGIQDTPWTKHQIKRTLARVEKMTVQVDEVKTETTDLPVTNTTEPVETETITEVENETPDVSTSPPDKPKGRKSKKR